MIKKVEEFLREKNGYLKEGPLRLKKVIEKQLDIEPTVEECRQALRNVRAENNSKSTHYYAYSDSDVVDSDIKMKLTTDSDVPEGFRVKSKWQNAKGEWLSSLERIDDDEDNVEDLIDSFKEIVKTELKVKYIKKKDTLKSGKSLKVWTSDKHLGACTKDAMHDNDYTLEEFRRRMSVVYSRILDLAEEHGPFDSITIADLGDAIDGMDGFTVSRTHKLPQNLTNQEMFDGYMSVHKQFFDSLFDSGIAKSYKLWLVTNSNHGGDFEYACHGALEAYIKGVYPEVDVRNLKDFLNLVIDDRIYYVLSHGKDKSNRKFGLPLYPNEKTEVLIENFLKLKNVPRNAKVRLIKGDLHQSASCPAKNLDRYKTVASVFGSSGWVMDNFGMTEPGCDYEILNRETGDIVEGIIKF